MSRRRLHPEERTLWKDVTRSIAPLRSQTDHEPANDVPAVASPPVKTKSPGKSAAKPVAAVPTPAAPRTPSRPEPAPLGRKAKRRLARGADAIHGRLDLHGMTQAEAHDALAGFLRGAQAKGAKVVLVITGKGARGAASGERGVLKRQVPMWLRLPEFREFVLGFEDAAIGHGGAGAIYVRLRALRG